MPGCITAGHSKVRCAGNGRRLFALQCYSQCRSATTSTVIKRYCASLSGAISSIRALPFYIFACGCLRFLPHAPPAIAFADILPLASHARYGG